jgi:DNA-binding GntR family transcriptional regulator
MNDAAKAPTKETPREAGDLAARIERDINIGTLSPGAWLKQIDLERRYGATRLDVRQALDGLVARRLVTHVPNRGYHVREFDQRQISDIYEVRAILEIAAAEQLVAHVTDERLRALTRRAEAFENATAHGGLIDQNEANLAFHAELLAMCPNHELVELIIAMRQRIPISVQRVWNSGARMAKSVKDHYRIIDALTARDTGLLKAITGDHILGNRPIVASDEGVATLRARG